jgi:hypothetical protein
VLAKTESATRGMSHLRLIRLPHPVGSIGLEALRFLAESSIDAIVGALTVAPVHSNDAPKVTNGSAVESGSELAVPADPALMFQYFVNRGWTDGLPVLPPTPASLDAMIAGSGLEKNQILGVIPPVNGIASIEKIAANAVMAGCLPDYFPLIVAAVKGVLQPGFNHRQHCAPGYYQWALSPAPANQLFEQCVGTGLARQLDHRPGSKARPHQYGRRDPGAVR